MRKRKDDSERRRQLWIYLQRHYESMLYAAGEGPFALPFTSANWREFQLLSKKYKYDPEFRDALTVGGYDPSMNPVIRVRRD